MIKIFFALLFLAASNLGRCAPALQDAACNKAIRSVVKFVASEKHKTEYYCSLHEQSASYIVFRVNSRYPAPADAGADWVGSNLVGYFAVNRANGKVYNWDIAKDRLGLLLHETTGAAPSNQDGNRPEAEVPDLPKYCYAQLYEAS
jgi:hypothetical protein